VKTVMNFRVP